MNSANSPRELSARNQGVDLFKLFAAFCVVTLHSGLYPEFPSQLGLALHVVARFAVPFFFLLSGYYLGARQDLLLDKVPPRIAKLVWIFCFASMIYVPFIFLGEGVLGVVSLLTPTFFVFGARFHLWFLSSMIVGMLAIYTVHRLKFVWVLPYAAVAILLLTVALGPYGNLFDKGGVGGDHFAFARQLLSVPYIYLGVLVARRPQFLTWNVSLLLALSGFGLAMTEALLLSARTGVDANGFEILLGTTPLAVGLLGIARSMSNRPRLNLLASWGRRYSLGIYIIHLLWLPIAGNLTLLLSDGEGWTLVQSSLTFGLSLVTLLVVEQLAPPLKRMLDGELG